MLCGVAGAGGATCFSWWKMEGQLEASSESMVRRVIFHDCTGDKPQRTGQSTINDMCSMWVSMLFMPAWPHRSPKVLVESHITSPWHIVFSTKVNTVWLFRAWLHNPIVATSISIVSWLQKLLGVVTRLFHDNPCNLHCKHHETLSRLNSCLRFGRKWWDG